MVSDAATGELLRRHFDGRVPGAALAIIRDGAPRFSGCFGFASLECRQPVWPTTVFRLASLSKPFTALAIVALEREGSSTSRRRSPSTWPTIPGRAGFRFHDDAGQGCTLSYPLFWITAYRFSASSIAK